MNKHLKELGFNEKEVSVYLALLQFGTQAASVISRKTSIPKSTVLFLLNGLFKKGYIRKSNKGNIQYFFAEPSDLKEVKINEIKKQQEYIEEVMPLLNNFKNKESYAPKVTFFEGVEGCKKAYLSLLKSQTEILEFGSHTSLEEKLGKKFMNDFIKNRAKNKILLKGICKNNKAHKDLEKENKKFFRKLKMFGEEKGKFHSSICIFENKVLLQNLENNSFSIIIENKEFSETLKTIHNLIWDKE